MKYIQLLKGYANGVQDFPSVPRHLTERQKDFLLFSSNEWRSRFASLGSWVGSKHMVSKWLQFSTKPCEMNEQDMNVCKNHRTHEISGCYGDSQTVNNLKPMYKIHSQKINWGYWYFLVVKGNSPLPWGRYMKFMN